MAKVEESVLHFLQPQEDGQALNRRHCHWVVLLLKKKISREIENTIRRREKIREIENYLPAAGGGLFTSCLFTLFATDDAAAGGGGISTLSPLTARSLVSILLNRWLKVIDVQCSATFGLPSSPSFCLVLKEICVL